MIGTCKYNILEAKGAQRGEKRYKVKHLAVQLMAQFNSVTIPSEHFKIQEMEKQCPQVKWMLMFNAHTKGRQFTKRQLELASDDMLIAEEMVAWNKLD